MKFDDKYPDAHPGHSTTPQHRYFTGRKSKRLCRVVGDPTTGFNAEPIPHPIPMIASIDS